MNVRPSKSSALSYVAHMAPQYADFLHSLQRTGGRYELQPRVAQYLSQIGDYVRLYENEQWIHAAFGLGWLGEQGLKELAAEAENLGPDGMQQMLDNIIKESDEIGSAIDAHLPETEGEWQAVARKFQSLPRDEQTNRAKQTALFVGSSFASFFNMLSAMIHGAKLTTLVPNAIGGDDDSFLKAVQIDPRLLIHSPFFKGRKLQAQSRGEDAFLTRLAYRETKPPFFGKIRYPGLYVMFACLETMNWLDDMTHNEILNLCDDANLDRYQNRIEDVNCVTKRLREYRRWQKTGGASMH